MGKLTIDADKIKIEGENLKTIARDYNTIMNEIYDKLINVTNNGVWQSEAATGSANNFIASVSKDKPNMMSLANSMNELGDKLIDFAKSINSTTDNKL